ncbi:hypothetical protein LCGC14_1071780 [marine sediment metagenome]|uniref:Uncharacterized protein n=1 Tax=marine sediment metagenome TaxID=412755 RepID=A0A0F9QNW0_9ZZZZ
MENKPTKEQYIEEKRLFCGCCRCYGVDRCDKHAQGLRDLLGKKLI